MDDDFAKSAGEIVGSALCGKGGEESRKKSPRRQIQARVLEPRESLDKALRALGELARRRWRAARLAQRARRLRRGTAAGSSSRSTFRTRWCSRRRASARRGSSAEYRPSSAARPSPSISESARYAQRCCPRAPPRRRVYRRAPVVNGEEEIAERAKFFLGGGMSPELAGAMAPRHALSRKALEAQKMKFYR